MPSTVPAGESENADPGSGDPQVGPNQTVRTVPGGAKSECHSQIDASSGIVVRKRLNRGGNRQANSALWRIVMVRMVSDPETRLYMERRTKEGMSKMEAIRCLKRYVARELYPFLAASAP